MEITGSHGFDQSIDYHVLAKVPAKLLGNQAGSLMSGLSSLAGQKGIDFEMPETLDVKLKLTGSFDNPKVAIDYEGTLAAAQGGFSNMAKDLLKSAKEKAEELKDMAIEKANEVKEQVTTAVQEKTDELKDKATEEATKAKDHKRYKYYCS